MSGIIAAGFNNGMGITGIAPNVQLFGVSVGGTVRQCFTQFLYGSAMTYLVATKGCKVLNVSQGFSKAFTDWDEWILLLYSSMLEKTMKKLLENSEFVVVVAAGNNSDDALLYKPIFIYQESRSQS